MDLTEDLVFDIIRYLPLKLAIQCKCLNKNFKKLISDPKIVQHHAPLSIDQPVLFSVFTRLETKPRPHRVLLEANPPYKIIENYYRISPYSLHVKNDQPSYVHSNLSGTFTVVMSSLYSGRILLQLLDDSYSIFNPVTGAFFVLPKSPSVSRFEAVVGLVDEVSSPHYKLVAVMSGNSSFRRLKVAIFESEHNSWRQRTYRTGDIGRRLTEFNPHNQWNLSQPVYVHGCLHFARQDGFILVFDVNKESLGIIKKPLMELRTPRKIYEVYEMWFGEGRGSLVLAVAFEKRVVIYVPDNVKNKWRSKTIIQNIPTVIQDPSPVTPIYCDGDDSLILITKKFDMYMYKINGGTLQKIGNPGMESFHPFIPKLVDIPCCKYLKSNNEKIELTRGEGEEGKDYMETQGLLNLQLLLRG